MASNFASIVDEVQKLSLEEKEELRQLLDKYLIEARREEIYQNYQDAKMRAGRGELKSSDNIQELRDMLEEDDLPGTHGRPRRWVSS